MARSSKALLVVIAAGATLGLGVGLFYLVVLAPKQELAEAQAEVQAWGERWAEVRACLVGDEPPVRDGGEAYLAREATGEPPPDELSRCEPMLYDLKRDPDASSGSPEIEGVWLDLKKPLRDLAEDLGWRLAKDKPRSIDRLRAALAESIAAMDAHHDALRQAVHLEPFEWPGRPLDALTSRPLEVPEGSRLDWVEIDSAGITYRAGGDQAWLIRQTGPDERTEQPLGLSVVRAAGGDWGLWRESDGVLLPPQATGGEEGASLRAGPLDAQGDPAGDGAELEAAGSGASYPVFAAGAGQDRVVLYRHLPASGSGVFRVRHSADGGASWSAPIDVPRTFGDELTHETRQFVDWGLGRTDLAWTEGGSVRWLPVRPGGPRTPRVVSRTSDTQPYAWQHCASAGGTWWQLGDASYFAAPGAAPLQVPGATGWAMLPTEIACHGDTLAAMWFEGGAVVATCSPAGCTEQRRVPSAPGSLGALAVSEAGKPVLVTQTGALLVRWDLAASPEPTLLGRVGDDVRLWQIVVWDGRLFAAASRVDEHGLAIPGAARVLLDLGDLPDAP